MEELYDLYQRYNQNNMVLDVNFLNLYADNLLDKYNAKDYLERIIISKYIHSMLEAEYIFNRKEILLFLKSIKKEIGEINNRRFNAKYDISELNSKIIYALSHECFHAVQTSIINDGDNTFEKDILNYSFKIYDNKLISYYDNYQYIPFENNAEICGRIYTTNFLNQNLNEQQIIKNNMMVADEILEKYTDEGGYISPTEVFYNLTEGKDKLEYLRILSKGIDTYRKIIYGLNLSDHEFNELEQIKMGNIKVLDIKKHLQTL